MKAHGKAAFIAEVQKASGKFHTKPGTPLYLFVYDANGVVLAHGAEVNLLGINRLNVKDPDGKQCVKEFLIMGHKKGGGWVDYKHMNSDDKKIENKTSFILGEEGVLIGGGIYK
jgi:signal transduction histidine kinase